MQELTINPCRQVPSSYQILTNYMADIINFVFQYQYADIAKRDILHAFQTYTDLRPKLDTFGKSTKIFKPFKILQCGVDSFIYPVSLSVSVFNDGSRKELLCLEGTIPVSYKGKCGLS